MRKIDLKNFQVATSETARDINRRIVLNFLRTHQPISRADLARKSGLQFSTVSLIVEELIAEQWVTEGAVTDAPRGRKPRVLHFNNERTRIIGIDIRPVLTTVAMADLSGRFVVQERMKTNPNPEKFMEQLCDMLEAFLKKYTFNFAGIGVSTPGRVDRETRRLTFAVNIGWRDMDIVTPLEAATGLPVIIEAAPNACALAEIWFGRHAENTQDLVAVTVSEGVGAGIFMNGQLLVGPTGMAGDYGHVSIVQEGLQCRCGNIGCWEMYASNRAAVRYYSELLEGKAGKRAKGKSASPEAANAITYDDLVRMSEEGDEIAIAALEKQGHFLGVGIAMIVTSLAPSAIVMVGELTHAWKVIGPQINEVVRKKTFSFVPANVVPTDDMVQPRLRGAVAVVLHEQLGAPLVA